MKKTICLLAAICLITALSGCKRPAAPTTQPTTTGTEATSAVPEQEPMYAVSVSTTTESVKADDGTLLFTYTHQEMSLVLPDPNVADKVIIDFLSRIDTTRSAADATLASAKNAYTGAANWMPYLCSIAYSPTRIDQAVLSLSGSNITYSGASHPDRISTSANYDMLTGDVLTLGSIMSPTAGAKDFCQLVLDVLALSKNDLYLYEGYEVTVRQRFTRDVSQDQDWYFTQNGLCFYFDPYEIASYAAGTVVAEIPYAKLAGLLNDSYFPPERVSAVGSVQASRMEDTNANDFSQIAEVVIDKNGQMVFLHTDGLVWDVQVSVGSWEGKEFIPSYTALYCHALSPGDAVMVQSLLTDSAPTLRLTFNTDTDTQTFYLSGSDSSVQLIK